MGYLGLLDENMFCTAENEPTIWLRSAKLTPDGEGLADKGFEYVDRCFAWFNRVRCPRVLRSRKVKQYDVIELASKADYCNLRCTSEVVFSFLENIDALKDVVPYHNIKITPCALEWVHGSINLQQPLRKPGDNSGIPSVYWD